MLKLKTQRGNKYLFTKWKNDENTNDLQQDNESMEGNDDIDLIMANAVPAKPI